MSVAEVTAYGRFDVGLSTEQEERARRLHRSSVIVDLHWQGPCSPDVWTEDLVAARGYNDDQVRGILGENLLRVFETVCG